MALITATTGAALLHQFSTEGIPSGTAWRAAIRREAVPGSDTLKWITPTAPSVGLLQVLLAAGENNLTPGRYYLIIEAVYPDGQEKEFINHVLIQPDLL